MEPIRSSYVEYGQGNMLNLDAGTIKRKIDSNEYDDEIIQEVQPNGKRTCSPMNHSPFSNFGTPTQTTPKSNGPAWSQPNPSPLLRTAAHQATALNHINNHNGNSHAHVGAAGHEIMQQGYQTPESELSSNAASPFIGGSNMDMDMESDSVAQDASPSMAQSASAMFSASLASPILSQEYHQQQLQQQHLEQQHQQQPTAAAAQSGTSLLPSALPVPGQGTNSNNEYVPVHGRSMQIPSYARVPLNEANEARRYRDQRWSSCIYGVDTRIGQGMMI
ncbi:hypothetical protein BG015_008946 [Linnemannia schmuckeri]|uniref:Uncharacterized protein n=1 Tax=Linnemannia schmuckeri TaxID=64567 RepID=A0A9P5VAA9_9FUNG|nr:hypothetical protein BG015_008946 [Linnemannia schmuckeri]